jgi:Ser/Thr protein kinase RdoA (MazF antagonist)
MSAEEIAAKACEAWDCITSVPQLFMHRENSVFKVATTHGLAALRVHRHGYHSRAAIESEMQWMAHLASRGVLVPAPIANRFHNFLSEIEHGGKIYSVDLLTWLDGAQLGNSTDPLGFSKSELQKIFFNLGQLIARLHDVTDAWNIPQGFTRHAWDRDGFLGERAFWGRFWEASDLSASDRHLLLEAREKAGTELDALRKAGANYGLIHADFVRQNILLVGAQVRVIDFDDSGFGFRMYDFATALVKNRDEPHYEAIKASLFEGYRSLRVLSQRDENSLDLFLTLRDFAYLGWMEARRGEPGVEVRMPGIRAATITAARKFMTRPVTTWCSISF